jgi:hypothetical protein
MVEPLLEEQWWSVAVIPVVVEDVVVKDLLVVPLPPVDLMLEVLAVTTAEQLWSYMEGVPIPMVVEDEEEG